MEELSIKVSEEVKNKILSQIGEYREFASDRLENESENLSSFQADFEMDISQLFNDNLKNGISKLQEKNIISLEFCHLLCGFFNCNDIELNLDEESKNHILKDLKSRGLDEDSLVRYQKKIFDNEFSVFELSNMYNFRNVLENATIPIDSDVASILLLDETGDKQEYWDKIKEGYIACENLLKFNKLKKPHTDLIQLYNLGLINEEHLVSYLGSLKFNPDLQEKQERYFLSAVKKSCQQAVEEILNYKGIDLESKGVSKRTIEKLSKFFSKIEELGDISLLDTGTLEGIYKEFNEISNEEWQDYLTKNPNSFLMHETAYPVKGKFRDPVISTSLITEDHYKTYGKTHRRGVGYIIKPKHISRASDHDVYVINSRKNVYSQKARLIVDFPQIVHEGMRERNEFSEIVIDDFEIESVVTLYSNVEQEVLQEYSSAQNGIPIMIRGFNKQLMSIEEYQYLDKQYDAIIQTSQSIPQTAKELYTQVQTEEDKFAKLAKYLGLDYELSGIDRTHISTIISHLENNSENMQRDMYKITDEDKIDEIRSKVECIEDLVSQACETTQSTYIKEMKSKFIGSYEAKIQQLITDSKIAKFKEGKTAVANQRVSIIGKLFGKEKLKEAQLVNLNKKMEIQRLRTYEKGFRDFSVDGEKGIMTPEIEEFIKLVESKPELENVAKEVKSIFASVIEQENQNNKIVPQNPKVSVRKQLKSIERENEMLSGEIRDIKVQDVKRKRGDVFTKIDNTKSNALIQLETILQNAEKSLHIENERDNDRIMQEVLDR